MGSGGSGREGWGGGRGSREVVKRGSVGKSVGGGGKRGISEAGEARKRLEKRKRAVAEESREGGGSGKGSRHRVKR